MQTVLGIDPGTRLTGYAVLSLTSSPPHQHELLQAGVVRLNRRASFSERLAELETRLDEIIQSSRPDAIAVEDIFAHRNARSALLLGHARGVVLSAASRHGVPVHTYAPASVKQAITGYGRATKTQVQLMVQTLLKLPECPAADAADAMAIALCHTMMSRHGLPIWPVRPRRQSQPWARRWPR